jgi:hypothetical protein
MSCDLRLLRSTIIFISSVIKPNRKFMASIWNSQLVNTEARQTGQSKMWLHNQFLFCLFIWVSCLVVGVQQWQPSFHGLKHKVFSVTYLVISIKLWLISFTKTLYCYISSRITSQKSLVMVTPPFSHPHLRLLKRQQQTPYFLTLVAFSLTCNSKLGQFKVWNV